tara:strand:- start:1788 stop:3464 length:1677 start_codon:yes stop_codon:yes gene_type:complete
MAQENEQQNGRWARIKSILSAAALLLSIIGSVAMVGGGALWLWADDIRDFGLGVMGVGFGILVVAGIFSSVNIRELLSGQRGRFAINSLVMIIAFVGIVVFVNFISYFNVSRADTTASKQFSLALQSVQVLEGLNQDVHATAFFIPDKAETAADRLLADDLMFEFERRSGRTFTYEFVDPESDPSTAGLFQLTQFPAIVFQARDTGQAVVLNVPPLSEQDLTSMLLIVTGEEQKQVYFLTGHGERDIINANPDDPSGFAFAARGVINDSYGAAPLNLAQTGSVPEDAAVIVIAGPTRNMALVEFDALDIWIKDGGRAIFMMDPPVPNSFRSLLEPWGITVGDTTIVDAGSSLFGDLRSPLLQSGQYVQGVPITRDLDTALFPRATPIEISLPPEKTPPWVRYTPLAQTTTLSWKTSDADRDDFDPGAGDVLGPYMVAMTVHACGVIGVEIDATLVPGGRSLRCSTAEGTKDPTTLVIFGDSDFAANSFAAYSTNLDFFLNSVNFATEDFGLISIRPKPFAFRELVVTSQEFDFIRFSSWFLLPSAVGLASVLVWWRRR